MSKVFFLPQVRKSESFFSVLTIGGFLFQVFYSRKMEKKPGVESTKIGIKPLFFLELGACVFLPFYFVSWKDEVDGGVIPITVTLQYQYYWKIPKRHLYLATLFIRLVLLTPFWVSVVEFSKSVLAREWIATFTYCRARAATHTNPWKHTLVTRQ